MIWAPRPGNGDASSQSTANTRNGRGTETPLGAAVDSRGQSERFGLSMINTVGVKVSHVRTRGNSEVAAAGFARLRWHVVQPLAVLGSLTGLAVAATLRMLGARFSNHG